MSLARFPHEVELGNEDYWAVGERVAADPEATDKELSAWITSVAYFSPKGPGSAERNARMCRAIYAHPNINPADWGRHPLTGQEAVSENPALPFHLAVDTPGAWFGAMESLRSYGVLALLPNRTRVGPARRRSVAEALNQAWAAQGHEATRLGLKDAETADQLYYRLLMPRWVKEPRIALYEALEGLEAEEPTYGAIADADIGMATGVQYMARFRHLLLVLQYLVPLASPEIYARPQEVGQDGTSPSGLRLFWPPIAQVVLGAHEQP